ncbi:DNA-binding LacI/PurR family transcriptional regulator [Marmoricola sp. URHA0025 HA25]
MTEPRATRNGRPPSMADVAKHAGVSHQTVSRVLNDSPLVREETRARVLAAIDELGYRRNMAARMLATNRSGRIGVISAHLVLYGPSMIGAAVQDAGHRAGYDVSLVGLSEFSARSLRDAVERLLDQAVEALVVAVAQRDAVAETRALQLAIPVVVVQGVSAGQTMAAGVDQLAGARAATEHLLDLGHRRVAHVTGPMDWVEAEQRREGWRVAQSDRGLLPGPELAGDWSAESGYAAGLQIAEDHDVTAVFAANDAMALGVLKALHEQGRRVPGDVSVVGFDDVPEAAYYWPSLTTVNQDFASLGRCAVELALRALDGEADPVVELVEPRLVARSSSGPMRPA